MKKRKNYARLRLDSGHHRRIRITAAVLGLLAFVPVALRLYYLMVDRYEYYAEKALRNQTRTTSVAADRGSIYDRNMNILAGSQSVENVYLDPHELKQSKADVPAIAAALGEILELTRKLIRWDVLEEPAEDAPLCGLTMDELRQHSHRPQEFYGQPHFMPSAGDGAVILQLNRARCAARQAELLAVDAFADREGNPTRTDLLRVLNRLSSMLYILMIREKAQRK